MSNFILVTSSTTTSNATRNEITAYLKGKGWNVWHWFEDLWLIDGAEAVDVSIIHRDLNALPSAPQHFIVINADNAFNVSGRVDSKAIEWFTKFWDKTLGTTPKPEG